MAVVDIDGLTRSDVALLVGRAGSSMALCGHIGCIKGARGSLVRDGCPEVAQERTSQLGREHVAIGRGVQRDRRDPVGDVEVDQFGPLVGVPQLRCRGHEVSSGSNPVGMSTYLARRYSPRPLAWESSSGLAATPRPRRP